ncbi:MAG TPA: MazG nucleotide pyrophosphohydrolase domain-containing protein, partial [archaeon]|nr:MazG nucleotide pyrophosphohydrolase domain-containing protein [archaeon]
AVLKNWEQLKAAERAEETRDSGDAHESILAGVPRSLPAVLEAHQLASRASHIGFDWENVEGIFEKLTEEMKELREAAAAEGSQRNAASPSARIEGEAGDLLAAAVNIARFLGVDPEIALKRANRKFKRRFEWMEAQAAREGRLLADVPRARMEELWNESKIATRKPHAG